MTPHNPSTPLNPIHHTPCSTNKGLLSVNIMHFGRLLRACGIPIGTDKVIQAIQAVEEVGVRSKTDFFWTLHTVFVSRAENRGIFQQAFQLFWRDPELIKRMMTSLLPSVRPDIPKSQPLQRLQDALQKNPVHPNPPSQETRTEISIDATQTWSPRERLQHKDFQHMQQHEIKQAQSLIQNLHLPFSKQPSLRYKTAPQGQTVDLRKTLKHMVRYAGNWLPLIPKHKRWKLRPIVVLCDISGSMEQYTRIFLHFVYTLVNHQKGTHSFVFGTRLTCITRYLKYRDVDVALKKVSESVSDWGGGTRIGECLHTFNREWNRRVLSQGALVLLMTDGLDQETGESLRNEMERLNKSCHWLIWLNPLLRYTEFVPKASGIRAILPYVDDFRPIHNLHSLTSLIKVLNDPMRHVKRPAR